MRLPPSVPMELVLTIALAASMLVIIFAMQDPPGDRTRFTVEPHDSRVIVERRPPLIAEEIALGR